MKKVFDSILNLEFLNISEAKASLSEQIRKSKNKNIAITQHGKPEAILINYQNYLELLEQINHQNPENIIDFAQWDKERKARGEVSRSISRHFDVSKLSQKGQKKYKKKRVHAYKQKTQ